MSLKWSEPQYDGGSEITSYIVEEREAIKRSWNRSGTVDASDKKVGIISHFMALSICVARDIRYAVRPSVALSIANLVRPRIP